MESLESLKSRLGKARVALGERKGQQKRLQLDRDACAAQLEEFLEKGLVFEQVVVLLQQTSEHARKQAREQIEMLVTNTLRSVFGGEYAFRIELTERAGRPEAEFYVVSTYNGEQLETRPQDSRGGGVVDVVSLGLRIAMLETYRPRLEGALILDEPAKHVSEEYIAPVATFLKMLSDYFDRQIIMVTHNPHLAETAEVAYSVMLKDGQSVVTRTA
ncbi:MAG TPA: ATPase [Symbiobacteriaceae bacterium]|nr:ATPase [Symbiobacteriaceae bacterium]